MSNQQQQSPHTPPPRDYSGSGASENAFSWINIDTENGKFKIGPKDAKVSYDSINCYIDDFALTYNSNPGSPRIPPHWEYTFRLSMLDPTDPNAKNPSSYSMTLHSHWKSGPVPDTFNTLLTLINDPSWDRKARFEIWLKQVVGKDPVMRMAIKRWDGTKITPFYAFNDELKRFDGVPMVNEPGWEDFWKEKAEIISKALGNNVIIPPATTQPDQQSNTPLWSKALAAAQKKWETTDPKTIDSLGETLTFSIGVLGQKYATDPGKGTAVDALVKWANETNSTLALCPGSFMADGKFHTSVTKNDPPKPAEDDLPF